MGWEPGGIFLENQNLRDEPRTGAAWIGQDSRAARGIFWEAAGGDGFPALGKASQIQQERGWRLEQQL